MSKSSSSGAIAKIVEREMREAIDECARAWVGRWNRKPTVNEIVSAFEICLSANPDEYVDDAATVLAMRDAPLPDVVDSRRGAPPAVGAGLELDPDAYDVALHDASPGNFNLDGCDLWKRGSRQPSFGCGDVRAIFEVSPEDQTVLVVDIWASEYGTVKTFDAARGLLHSLAMRPYLRKKKGSAGTCRKARYRSMDGLEAPVDVVFAWLVDD